MESIRQAASAFLAKQRIAVTGVSRTHGDHGANVVYKRLKDCGYQVFPVNPNATDVAGDACFPDLKSIPGGVEAVVIATGADHAEGTMHEIAELGIQHAWMHRSFGEGSVSKEATMYGRAHGVHVIDGGCPLMFPPVSDPGHQVMRVLFTLTGKVPKQV